MTIANPTEQEARQRERLAQDSPERLVLADALGEMQAYRYEDKYAMAFALLSRLAAQGIVVIHVDRVPGFGQRRA